MPYSIESHSIKKKKKKKSVALSQKKKKENRWRAQVQLHICYMALSKLLNTYFQM